MPKTRSLTLPKFEATTPPKHNMRSKELWNTIRYVHLSIASDRLLTCHQKHDRNAERYICPAEEDERAAQPKARGRQDLQLRKWP